MEVLLFSPDHEVGPTRYLDARHAVGRHIVGRCDRRRGLFGRPRGGDLGQRRGSEPGALRHSASEQRDRDGFRPMGARATHGQYSRLNENMKLGTNRETSDSRQRSSGKANAQMAAPPLGVSESTRPRLFAKACQVRLISRTWLLVMPTTTATYWRSSTR